MKRAIIIILTTVLLHCTVYAQTEVAEWEHYFSSNILHTLYCGGGYVWSFQPAHNRGLLQFNPETEKFEHFHAGNQAKSNHINKMITDSKGGLWCQTGGGFFRIDGDEWSSLEIPGNTVSFTTGMNGSLWFGGKGFVAKYDGANWETSTISDSVSTDEFRYIATDSVGNVCAADWRILYSFNGEIWQLVPIDESIINPEMEGSDYINFLDFDKNNKLWCGTGYGKVLFRNGESWEILEDESILKTANMVSPERIEEILVDNRGYVWCRMDVGLKYYNGKNWVSVVANDYNNRVSDLCFDSSDNVYCATEKDGILMFDGTSWKSFTTENGLTTNNVRSLDVDDDGIVWCGMYYDDFNGDISRFNGVDWWETYKHDDGLTAFEAHNIYEVEGVIWTLSSGLIFQSITLEYFDGQRWKQFSDEMLPEGITGIKPVTTIDGLIFFILDNKLYYRINGIWSNIPFEGVFELPYIRAICVDKSGNVWVGGDSIYMKELETRVARYNGSWTIFTIDDGFDGSGIQHLYSDSKGMLWCTSQSGPVGKYDGSIWTWYTLDDGLAGERIRDFGEDAEGNLYCGEVGLSMYDGTKWNRIQAPGEPASGVYSIHVEENGNVWLATAELGLGFYDGTSWTMYTTEDGLCSNRIYTVFVASDGNVWCGTDVGISVLKLDNGVNSSVDTIQNKISSSITMSQPAPNPFNLSTTISYNIPQDSKITLSIYNISGQLVSMLKDEYQQAGNYSATWDAKGFPSGLYFCILQANGFTQTRKMVLVK